MSWCPSSVTRARFADLQPTWAWRAVHSAAYLAWVLGILHGLLAGRSAKPYVDWSYGACVAAVALALILRMVISERVRETPSNPVPAAPPWLTPGGASPWMPGGWATQLDGSHATPLGHHQAAQMGYQQAAQMGHQQAAQLGHEQAAQLGHEQAAQLGHQHAAQLGQAQAYPRGADPRP